MELPAILEKCMLSVVRFSLFALNAVMVQPVAVEKTSCFTVIAVATVLLTVRVELMVTFPPSVRPLVMVTVGASSVMEVAAVALMVLRLCRFSC